ncbi:MAG: hypothetical protein KA369_17840 [Spirochaetes bacterium]|nr:hypothetical protein [Spirochaetota bacterium]
MEHTFLSSAKIACIGGIASFAVSAALNYLIIPMPLSILDNSINHGIGGFFCGFISALVGVLMFARRHGRGTMIERS